MKSNVTFGDEKLKEEMEKLKDVQENRLYEQLTKAFKNLSEDAFCGTQIPKRLIPEYYKKRFGSLTNLWKYNLPDAWRLIYTVENSKVSILSVVLEWLDHKGYERRFKY